jgi:hypothetical protein
VANLKGARKRGLEFWQAAVERLQEGEKLAEVAAELKVDRRGLYRWQVRLNGVEETPGKRREKALAKEVERLQKALAQRVLEVDFLQGALHKIEARRRGNTSGGVAASTTRCEK